MILFKKKCWLFSFLYRLFFSETVLWFMRKLFCRLTFIWRHIFDTLRTREASVTDQLWIRTPVCSNLTADFTPLNESFSHAGAWICRRCGWKYSFFCQIIWNKWELKETCFKYIYFKYIYVLKNPWTGWKGHLDGRPSSFFYFSAHFPIWTVFFFPHRRSRSQTALVVYGFSSHYWGVGLVN